MENRRQQNKKKNVFIFITSVTIILIIIFTLLFNKKSHFPSNFGIYIKNHPYYLEVAQNNQERKIGLSNRTEICSNCGMLFIFNKEGKYPFWMKDTHIPLDMIWLNEKQEIVKIITAFETDSETIYINQQPAKYVIELPANESLKLNLQIGDTVPIFQDQ